MNSQNPETVPTPLTVFGVVKSILGPAGGVLRGRTFIYDGETGYITNLGIDYGLEIRISSNRWSSASIAERNDTIEITLEESERPFGLEETVCRVVPRFFEAQSGGYVIETTGSSETGVYYRLLGLGEQQDLMDTILSADFNVPYGSIR